MLAAWSSCTGWSAADGIRIVKWLNILSSTLLFGTGLGSAFYMFFASRTRDPRVVAAVARSRHRRLGFTTRPWFCSP